MRSKGFVMFTMGLLLASCASTSTPAVQKTVYTPGEIKTLNGVQYVRTQVVVRYSKPAALQTVLKTTGGRVLDTIPELNAVLIELPDQKYSPLLQRQVKTDSAKVAQVLNSIDGVLYAGAGEISLKPKDGVQLNGSGNNVMAQGATVQQQFDGPTSLPQYALDANHLNAKAAWDLGFTGAGALVGIMDDPADVTHEDLSANWAGKAYDPLSGEVYTTGKGWIDAIDGMDGKVDGKFDPEISHGTYVASTVSAAKNGKGIVGVSPDAKFFPVALSHGGFLGDFYIAKGLIWAVNNQAQVLNNSWGGYGYGDLIKAAMDYAIRKNVVVVASASNDGKNELNTNKPGGYPGIIASGAASANRDRVGFSTYGRGLSTVAPGHEVILASPSFQHGGVSSYGPISGTSFSGPYTAGAAALIKGKFPQATPYQVKKLLETTADDVNAPGYDIYTGYGHVNVGKLAQKLKTSGLAGYQVGGAAKINVQYFDVFNAPGLLADVTLVHKDFLTRLDAPRYFARTDTEGNAYFYGIEPGEYNVLVAGPDIQLVGGEAMDRGSAIGTITVEDNTIANPSTETFLLNSTPVDLNPVDIYEPNNTFGTATEVDALPFTSAKAYIYDPTGEQQYKDLDWYTFAGKAGQTVTVDVLARSRFGGNLDSYLVLFQLVDGKLKFLAEHDDIDPGKITDSTITQTLSADGQYVALVSSYNVLVDDLADSDPLHAYKLKISVK